MKRDIAIALAILFGATCGVGTTCAVYETAKERAVQETEVPAEALKDGAVVTAGAGLTVTKISAENYATEGVAENVDSAYTLTASVNEDALDKRMEWSVAWKNAESEWATGKTVTDYVTITPSEEGSLTATATCLQDFGEQIIITAKSVMTPSATATCTVDYAKKIKAVVYYNGKLDIKETEDGKVWTFHPVSNSEASTGFQHLMPTDYEFSEYTLDDSFLLSYTYVKYSSALATESLQLWDGATEWHTHNGIHEAPFTFVDAYACEKEESMIIKTFRTLWGLSGGNGLEWKGSLAEEYYNHVAALIEADTRDLMTVRVRIPGEYSTYEEEIEVRMDSVGGELTQLTLDNENLVF